MVLSNSIYIKSKGVEIAISPVIVLFLSALVPEGLSTNALMQTALREENRAYVQIDPAEK